MDTLPLLGYAPGTLAIWAALLGGGVTTLVYLYAWRLAPARVGIAFDARRDSPYDRAIGLARRLYGFYAGTIVLSSVVLLTLLLKHDFRVSYVASYSGRDLPLRYLLSTFWAGQEGSFLLWLFWGAIIGLFVLRTAKEQEPAVMVVYLATFLGIVIILVKQSPF